MISCYVPGIKDNVRSLSKVLREKPDTNINNYRLRQSTKEVTTMAFYNFEEEE